MDESPHSPAQLRAARHRRWVKFSHWLGSLSFLALVFTGVVILMAHPRLYWGETGNDLTPALIELPISRNHQHGGWEKREPFFQEAGSPVSASRTYEIFNQNGWGRSLHFLAAWFLVLTGLFYLLAGIFSGHFWRHLLPRRTELSRKEFLHEVKEHARLRIRAATGGPHYGLLQKCAYCFVLFIMLPLIVITGLTMSPTLTAVYPFLLRLFGGYQSARTLHFFAFIALLIFLIGHVAMVALSGFKRQMRGMTLGGNYENE